MKFHVSRAVSRAVPVALVATVGLLVTGCGSSSGKSSGDAAQPAKTTTVAAANAKAVGCKDILAAVPDDPFNGNEHPSADQIRTAMGTQDATLTPMVDQVTDPKVKSALRAYVQVLDQIKTAPDDNLVTLSSGPLQTTAKALDAVCPS
ncbi:hypothetical protein [Nocardia terrae]|nr:hypothetical protein [Nocardia terrae]